MVRCSTTHRPRAARPRACMKDGGSRRLCDGKTAGMCPFCFDFKTWSIGHGMTPDDHQKATRENCLMVYNQFRNLNQMHRGHGSAQECITPGRWKNPPHLPEPSPPRPADVQHPSRKSLARQVQPLARLLLRRKAKLSRILPASIQGIQRND